MYSLNVATYQKPGNEHGSSAINGIFNYDVNSKENYRIQVDEMNNQIKHLEKSIGDLKSKVKAYQDIILKYESIFREEISLYRLQKSKLTTMQEAFLNQELFAKEIEQHISTYIAIPSKQKTKFSSFKRIILRFFNQNKLNQNNANIEISEIQNLIDKKQQLLEKFQMDVENWKTKSALTISSSDPQQIGLN